AIAELTREPKSLMPPVAGETRDLLAYLTRLTGESGASVATADSKAGGLPFDAIANPKPGDWPTYHGQLSGNRHSALRDINTSNVAQLAPRWMFTIPNARRLEGTPIVVDGVMYVTAANEAYALDARSGRQIWRYARPLTKGVIGDASGAINRGVAIL